VAAPRPATGNGSLVIQSQPSGAAITVNGMSRGKTPLTIGALPAGDYTVGLALDGYEPVSLQVRVTVGERSTSATSLTASGRQP
jgi:hypothetical protein